MVMLMSKTGTDSLNQSGKVPRPPQLLALLLALAALVTPAVGQDRGAGVPPAFEGKLVSLAAVNVRDATLTVMAEGLARPRAFEFISPDEVLVSEIHSGLVRIDTSSGRRVELSGVPDFVSDHQQTGLFDVALHPAFSANRRIYFSYAERDEVTGRYYTLVLATALLAAERLERVETLLRVEPYGWSPSNFGGAIAFDDDGMLYFTVGDRSEDGLAQQLDRLEGKVLRLHDDGRVPADNPFHDHLVADPRIYALGVRNAQGLYFDSPSGLLIESEHGPLGGDEINLIRAGANYGWPRVSYGQNYSTAPIGEGTALEGTVQPVFYYLPSEAISPVVRYRGTLFPEWDGHLLVGALKGAHVSKLDFQGGRVMSSAKLLTELNDRVRDLKVHEDGALWVLLQGGRMVRLGRDGQRPPLEPTGNPADIYTIVCAGCHDVGANGAPKPGDLAVWERLRAGSRDALYERVISGFNAMPARGLCNICTDEHLRATTDYMLDFADEPGDGAGTGTEQE